VRSDSARGLGPHRATAGADEELRQLGCGRRCDHRQPHSLDQYTTPGVRTFVRPTPICEAASEIRLLLCSHDPNRPSRDRNTVCHNHNQWRDHTLIHRIGEHERDPTAIKPCDASASLSGSPGRAPPYDRRTEGGFMLDFY
jgi:hypothetical protein